MKYIHLIFLFFIFTNHLYCDKCTVYYTFWGASNWTPLKTIDLLKQDTLNSDRLTNSDGIVQIENKEIIISLNKELALVCNSPLNGNNIPFNCKIAVILEGNNRTDTIGIGEQYIEINGLQYVSNLRIIILLRNLLPKIYAVSIDEAINKILLWRKK